MVGGNEEFPEKPKPSEWVLALLLYLAARLLYIPVDDYVGNKEAINIVDLLVGVKDKLL